MADIVNLNRARKAKTKAEAKMQAAANRLLHGRNKSSKLAEKQESSRAARAVDDAKRER